MCAGAVVRRAVVGCVKKAPSKATLTRLGRRLGCCRCRGHDGVGQGVVRSFYQWRAEMQWGNKKRHLGFFDRREWSGVEWSGGSSGRVRGVLPLLLWSGKAERRLLSASVAVWCGLWPCEAMISP